MYIALLNKNNCKNMNMLSNKYKDLGFAQNIYRLVNS